ISIKVFMATSLPWDYGLKVCIITSFNFSSTISSELEIRASEFNKSYTKTDPKPSTTLISKGIFTKASGSQEYLTCIEKVNPKQ
ncbi:MAG: hypothetical protein N0E54_03690, partial [Candidatus Thiodiazotropha taylori]|nr:hypothetical protein [Candidatus Thiodiazotropha endolucinida]MCW4227831.1 hypothetical protein [Candidatus Thiodiazotropha taylori]